MDSIGVPKPKSVVKSGKIAKKLPLCAFFSDILSTNKRIQFESRKPKRVAFEPDGIRFRHTGSLTDSRRMVLVSNSRRCYEMLMKKYFPLILAFLILAAIVPAQTAIRVVDEEEFPELLRHLPEWESVLQTAVLARTPERLRSAIGEREVIDLIEFAGGTEAVTANYEGVGRLLIVEYPTPQASVAADTAFLERLSSRPSDPPTVYRRIGNYNAFVFDAKDAQAAAALLDQVKYEKTVQWLGEDPNYMKKAERYLATSTADVIISTALLIVISVVFVLVTGGISGYVFFRVREQRRASMSAYSDAGGMTRLNLDDLTSPIDCDRLLGD